MFNSVVLDVAIALVFSFLTISLLASAVTEAIASIFKWRSTTLFSGIKDLLNDQAFTGLAKSLYAHALVNPRADGKTNTQQRKFLPAYVDSTHFASALLDVMGIVEGSPEAVKQSLSKVENAQLKQLVGGIVDRAGGKLHKIQGELAAWFDASMDRVGGAYKRRTQLCSFLIALLLAGALNVDAFRIAGAVWRQPMLIKTLEVTQGDTPEQVLGNLNAHLPAGWTTESLQGIVDDPSTAIIPFFGWLITAVATLFGAPFWFDALRMITRLKGSGQSPAEKHGQREATQ